jgi:hypothetical protein
MQNETSGFSQINEFKILSMSFLGIEYVDRSISDNPALIPFRRSLYIASFVSLSIVNGCATAVTENSETRVTINNKKHNVFLV